MTQSLDHNSVRLETEPSWPVFYRPRFWCALAVTISVFPLIWMGGLVTSHGVGMSVPDWPNSYGYNMFLFPPSQWVGGIFYEHTHRLLGTLSGFLSVALVATTWAPARKLKKRRFLGWITLISLLLTGVLVGIKIYLIQTQSATYEFIKSFSHLYVTTGSVALFAGCFWLARQREERRWVRWLTVIQLLAIIIQGTLGGLRVTEVNTTLAIIHGCFAQLFFALTGFTTLVMTRWWHESFEDRRSDRGVYGRRAVLTGAILILLIILQLVVGATMRHHEAGLAIPDLPLAFGKWLPPMDEESLRQANAIRAWDYHLSGQMSLVQMWLHFGHRIGAVLVTAAVTILAFQVFLKLHECRTAVYLTVSLCILVTIQFTLGVLAVYTGLVKDITALHVAFGALTMLTGVLTTAAIARVYGIRKPVADLQSTPVRSSQGLVTA